MHTCTAQGSSRNVDADIVVLKVTGSSEGTLQVGDRLLSVNGVSTRGLQYQQVGHWPLGGGDWN